MHGDRHVSEYGPEARKALRAAHLKAFVPVPMPVDVTDETEFPNIAEAVRYVKDKGLV